MKHYSHTPSEQTRTDWRVIRSLVPYLLEFKVRLVAVVVLPFTIPVLIFGAGAASAAAGAGGSFGTPFAVLIALTLTAAVVAPVAGAAALRAAAE